MNLTETIIETKRLKLTAISKSFVKEIYEEFSDDITLYMYSKPTDDIHQMEAYVDNSISEIKNGSSITLVILTQVEQEFLGIAAIHEIDSDTPELGVWIKKSAHGNKYGLEAITALINWSKENLKFDYLRYPVDKRNIASRKIAETNGGIIKKEAKRINKKGFELDEVEYWIYK
jgi:[ribosomal protein S5]-alanine N-acetyltransferase